MITIVDNGTLTNTGDILIAFPNGPNANLWGFLKQTYDPQPDNNGINICGYYVGPIKRSSSNCGIYHGSFFTNHQYAQYMNFYIHLGFTSQPTTFGTITMRLTVNLTRVQ
jgi:hypothetical protein